MKGVKNIEDSINSWKEVILDFFENRLENINSKPQKCLLYKCRKRISDLENKIASEREAKKISKLTEEIAKAKNELRSQREESPSGEIRQWIDATSKKKLRPGKKFIEVTHALKFSHSSSAPDGINYLERCTRPLLSTGSITKDFVHDIAHSNGNLISISKFLSLSIEDEKIIDLIKKQEFSFLEPFSKNKKQQEDWENGFSELVEEREIKTAEKAKQIYFPNSSIPESDKDYDLLIPLFSSSLAEKIYVHEGDRRFGEEHKEIREARKGEDKKSKYHSGVALEIPNLGVLKFGGANSQNVSMLNQTRSWKANVKDRNSYGITYLFSSQPPFWQSQLKPPIYKKSLFSNLYSETIKTEIYYLREFLIRTKKIGHSIKKPEYKPHIERWLHSIVDEFLFYVGTIQNLPAGWSESDINLKKPHQYLLDPYRDDDEFQAARNSEDWQKVLQDDFADWLNNLLKGKDKQFTPQTEHTRLWNRFLATPLREYMEGVDAHRKQLVGGVE